MQKTVELLWFAGCPSHERARALVREVVAEVAPGAAIVDVDATDPAVAAAVRFPGSPTIRVDGIDVDPTFEDPGEYAPRCRLYRDGDALGGVPPRAWLERALRG